MTVTVRSAGIVMLLNKWLMPALMLCAGMPLIVSCSGRSAATAGNDGATCVDCKALRDSIESIVSDVDGEVGVAVIVNRRDTVTVNDNDVYPLMSVFKLHQAVALCHDFDVRGVSLDTTLLVRRSELNPDTWSPMLKDYTAPRFEMSVSRLMRYALMQSDNNASNLMFDRLLSVAQTDSFIATLVPRDGFRLAVSESDMMHDHGLAYANHSSPSATAVLIDRLFNDSILSSGSRTFICNALRRCATGADRIAAPLVDKDGVVIAHKTGSGYVNEQGRLVAHNDVAYVVLPDGTSYSLVVFVKDFAGTQTEASWLISRISSVVYTFLSRSRPVS